MDIKKIKPKKININNEDKYVKYIWLNKFSDYNFISGQCEISYILIGEEYIDYVLVFIEYEKGNINMNINNINNNISKEESILNFICDKLNIELL